MRSYVPSTAAVIQLTDPQLDILIKTQQNHIVDAGPDKEDRQAFIHARLGYRSRCFTNFVEFTEKDTLNPSLFRIKGICLAIN